jgi:heat shock protein HtpX
MLRDLGNIVKNHFLYVVCSLIYFLLGALLLGGSIYAFIGSFVLYVLSVIISLSPVAEKMLRFIHGIRSIETREERRYLSPIFREVYNPPPQKRVWGKKKHRIFLYLIDNMTVNATAVGRYTVAITKGAMTAFDEEQLKGVIAHELAHIKNGDTVASMFLLIGSGYFYLFVFFLKFIIFLMDKITASTEEKSTDRTAGNFMCSVVRAVTKIIVFVFCLFMNIVTAIESREREYKADETAFRMGHGEGLISALYLLEKMNLGKGGDFVQKLTASHPRTTARIRRLELMRLDDFDDDYIDLENDRII